MTRRLARQSKILGGFNIIIKYISRTSNTRVDTLSQKPSYKGDKEYKRVVILKTLPNRDLAPTN